MLDRLVAKILRQKSYSAQSAVLTVKRLLHDAQTRIHPCILQALECRTPVVALESTILTHGMPHPHNIRTANEVEQIVRENGAVPATIGILNGRVHVGLTEEELQYLSQSKDALKVSRRDLPYALSQGACGGTTVSATMIAAHKAGIRVFVTGGIGGVHRGAEITMDVSADLTELGRTPIAVVSAGVKSILDIGKTLEYLETQGICVATFGSSREFPAFFTPRSGIKAPYNVCNVEEAASLIDSSLKYGLCSGLLIAVPIPEAHAASGQVIEEAIHQAVTEARSNGIVGKDVTPYILQRVNELTQGESLKLNVSLIKNNARIGACIACALSQIQQGNKKANSDQNKMLSSLSRPVVVGGINVDFIAKSKQKTVVFSEQTTPGTVYQSFGGVGRNLADCLTRLDMNPLFISAIGMDMHSDSVLRFCSHMDMAGVARFQDHRTATYCAVISGSGELKLGLGDMEIHQQITEQYVATFRKELCSASLICIDGNVPVSTIDFVCRLAWEHGVSVWFEPTDVDKACKPFLSDSWKSLTYTSPNIGELKAMNMSLGQRVPSEMPVLLNDVINTALMLARPLLEHLLCVVITLGPHGVLLCGRSEGGRMLIHPHRKQNPKGNVCAIHYPAITISQEEVVNVSGAGDCFAAGMIAGILSGKEMDTCVRMALFAALHSLKSNDAVSPKISPLTVTPQGNTAQCLPDVGPRWIKYSQTNNLEDILI
ncbi:pseudouridine-metabolizing bifunctional protein C1861.05-like [Protopterus annectens]|uniref:pseudouridine-metabolizing bifunctional protein C1861.05-like n=1 Tax=Protopterus annectens TaxID=7888 RepID=UPI001CF946AD|nr:pseudouridine-metabolizing bifunctional protein C1861.05-like [Protopterus annectens]